MGKGVTVGKAAGPRTPGAFEGRENEEDGRGLPLREDILRRAIPLRQQPYLPTVWQQLHGANLPHFSVWTVRVGAVTNRPQVPIWEKTHINSYSGGPAHILDSSPGHYP